MVEVDATGDLGIRLREVPEVESVVGKIGRAESALDPAPIGMIETIIILKPEDQWRMVKDKNGKERRITKQEIIDELQAKTSIPGVLPTWLQPIQTRIVMLQTGFRAMMGVKIYGSDPKEIERVGLQIEQILRKVPGATDVVADRMRREQIEHVLASLDGREQRVLRLRFGLDDGHARTLEEVGREFGLTRERIRQIEVQALRKLRHPSRSRKLREFAA